MYAETIPVSDGAADSAVDATVGAVPEPPPEYEIVSLVAVW